MEHFRYFIVISFFMTASTQVQAGVLDTLDSIYKSFAGAVENVQAGLRTEPAHYPEAPDVDALDDDLRKKLEKAREKCDQPAILKILENGQLPKAAIDHFGPLPLKDAKKPGGLYAVALHRCLMSYGVPSYLPRRYRIGTEKMELARGIKVDESNMRGTFPPPGHESYKQSRLEELHKGQLFDSTLFNPGGLSEQAFKSVLGSEVSSKSCAKCHSEQYRQWQGTAHSTAMRGSYEAFRMTVAEAIEATCDPNKEDEDTCADGTSRPIRTTVFCNGCHSPGTMRAAGVLKPEEGKDSSFFGSAEKPREMPESTLPSYLHLSDYEMDGVSCFACHSQQKLDNKVDEDRGFLGMGDANRAFISLDASNGKDGVFLKLSGPAELGDRNPPHGHAQWEMNTDFDTKGLLPEKYAKDLVNNRTDSSRFCISCHDVRLPGQDHYFADKGDTAGEKFRRLENLGTEYREYKDAGGEHTCVSCHMSTYGHCIDGEPGEFPVAPLTALSSVPNTRLFQVHGFPGVTSPQNTENGRYSNVFNGGMDALGLGLNRKEKKACMLQVAAKLDNLSCDQKLFKVAKKPLEENTIAAKTSDENSGKIKSKADAKDGILRIVLDLLNDGTGHRIPSGFSQEREVWIKLKVTDEARRVVYRSGYTWGELEKEDPAAYRKALQKVVDHYVAREKLLNGRDKILSINSVRELEQYVNKLDLTNEFVLLNSSNDGTRVLSADIAEHGPDEDHRADGQYIGLRKFTNKFKRLVDGKKIEVFSAHLGQIMENRHSIPFGERVKVTYDIPVDETDVGNYTVDASLVYRAFPPHFADAVQKREQDRAQEQATDRQGRGPVFSVADYEDSVEPVVMAAKNFTVSVKGTADTRCEWVGEATRTYTKENYSGIRMGKSLALAEFANYGYSGQCAEQRYDDWTKEFNKYKLEFWDGRVKCQDKQEVQVRCRAQFEEHRPTAEECLLQSKVMGLTASR